MTTGGRLRVATAAAFVLFALTSPSSFAAGQTYTVVQCHPLNRRTRECGARGRFSLCGARVLRRPSQRLCDQGQQRWTCAIRQLRPGSLAARIPGPGHRRRRRQSEAPPRQQPRPEALDGRLASQRGGAGRHRRHRPDGLPALPMARRRPRSFAARRQPFMPALGRLSSIHRREGLGAGRSDGGGGLLESEIHCA